MSTGGEKIRRRRARLMEVQDGRCYWCGCEMVLPPFPPVPHGKRPDNEATIDHLDDRWDDDRGAHPFTQRTVLACNKCNNERGNASQANQPKELLWAKSGAYPQDHPMHINLKRKQRMSRRRKRLSTREVAM